MIFDHFRPMLTTGINWSTVVSGMVPIESVDPIIGQSGLTLAVVGVVGFLVVVGVGITVVRRGKQKMIPDQTTTEPRDTATDATKKLAETTTSAETSSTGKESIQLSDRTLNRLEPIAPTAVSRARKQQAIDWSKSELRSEIEEKIIAGRLDPSFSSSFGDHYDVVNLPSQYRELKLPVSGETVHVANIDKVARETVANDPPQDVARTVAAIDDHCQQIRSYIDQQELAFLDDHNPVGATLDDIRELTNRFEGSFGNRLTEFTIESRHDDLAGVVEIERRLVDARRLLHQAAFDDAMRTVENAAQMADDLLVTTEFVGGVVGTIDHGSGTVPIPDSVPKTVLADLVPLAKQQYNCSISITDQELVITTTQMDGEHDSDPSESFVSVDNSGATRDSGTTNTSDRSANEYVRPEAITDEVLFLFRELDTNSTHSIVEYQTEQLPDSIGRPEVLRTVVSFCTRQSDIVDTVKLQDDAPPGFLEIEFTDSVNAKVGVETLHERYISQYGSAS